MKTPLAVRPTRIETPVVGETRTNPGWKITLGKQQVAIDEMRAKHQAIEQATQKARADNRPGVVVFKTDGKFQRFDANERYFEDY